MNIPKGRLVTILVVVVGILVLYLCYWYFLVPPLKVVNNGFFNSLDELATTIRAPYPDTFLVVVVKVNHWPGPMMQKDFDLQHYEFPSIHKVEVYTMNTLPPFSGFSNSGMWGQNVTLEAKTKYVKLAFVVPSSVTEATLTYRGQQVSTFKIKQNPFD